MQLSAPTTSPDLLLAAFAAPKLAADGLLPFASSSAAPGQPAANAGGENAPAFAQLFPDLAPATTAGVVTAPVGQVSDLTLSAPLAPALNLIAPNLRAPVASPASPVAGQDLPPHAADGTEAKPDVGVPAESRRDGPPRAGRPPRGAPSADAANQTPNENQIPFAPAAMWLPAEMLGLPVAAAEPAASVDPSEESSTAPQAACEPGSSGGTPLVAFAGLPASMAAEATFAGEDIAPRAELNAFASPRPFAAASRGSIFASAPASSSEAPVLGAPPTIRQSSPTDDRAAAVASFSGDEDTPPSAPTPLTNDVVPAKPEFGSPVVGAREGPPAQVPTAFLRDPFPLAVVRGEPIEAAFAPPADAPAAPSVRSLPSVELADATRAADAITAAAPREGDAPTPLAPRASRQAAPRAAAAQAQRNEEKIAGLVAEKFDGKNFVAASSPKTFLNAAEERVVPGTPDLGIDVANSSAPMPALAFNRRSAPTAVPAHAAPLASALAPADFAPGIEPSLATEAPAAAHRAVEAVLTAAERFAAGDRHAVNLQFSVGGADLAVRVELRADEVRATFRTDSPELRGALAQEWQAVATDSAERPFRLAPPVFTSNSPDASAFAGDGGPQQRSADQQNAPHTAREVFAAIASRGRAAATRAADEVALPAARLGALPTSLHLHTLA